MCGVCGCGEGETTIEGHGHHHAQSDHHGVGLGIDVEEKILAVNTRYAARNRELFKQRLICSFNLVSSPGSGKTTLLVETLRQLASDMPIAVIEGDQQTSVDAERIRETGVEAIQINTGKGCHLDAHMVGHAADKLALAAGTALLVENVGNLVCPAEFDLGEHRRILILSVTEGEDKPLKYPHIFRSADLLILTKSDLLPYLDFNVERCLGWARQIKPQLPMLTVSAKTGEGMAVWISWLQNCIQEYHLEEVPAPIVE
jgi:hydrogenase nickel incorporation protein HypB